MKRVSERLSRQIHNLESPWNSETRYQFKRVMILVPPRLAMATYVRDVSAYTHDLSLP